MSGTPAHADDLEQLKRALVTVRKLRARLDELEQAQREPIAIVGIGCRLPGAHDVQAFWDLLRNGVDAIRDVPSDRWAGPAYLGANSDVPGTMPTQRGGFLESVDRFDPHFFGISPREASLMDPQQRLTLEVAWEALEDAGIPPDQVANSSTGVFIGIGLNDYGRLQVPDQVANPALNDAYSASGNALCITANRLSYTLNLHGPSMAIDTACSSSLVAVHQACRSLRSGESSLALVGGTNLILTPDTSISLRKFLAPDGRCKFGDARADGYVRGEGVVMTVLMTLARARAEGRPIYALIRGSTVNQDGYSSGLTVPNGVAQQALLRQALADTRLEPHQIAYVEAHGTGTALGDPIEIQALGTVMGSGRPAGQPLLIGSVKTNIGHLEAGAGIAGLVKVALALKHGFIPPSLHYQAPNPHIPYAALNVRVATELTPWPAGDGPRLAGVSSFGFGGTNAHIVIEEAPPLSEPTATTERPLHLLALSAKEPQALRDLAGRYANRVAADPDLKLADLAWSANTGRSHFAHRAAFVAATAADLQRQLEAIARNDDAPGATIGHLERAARPRVAFLFTGQGSQYAEMGRQLYETEPLFRTTLDRCADLLRPLLAHDLRDVLFGADEATRALIDQTAYTQPALFALEAALCDLWQAWGIVPAALLGHSVGEYVAAYVAGVFTLEEGLRLMAARGRLMQSLPAGGAMAAIFVAPPRIAEALRPYADRLAIAAINEPEHVVISGDATALDALCGTFAADGVKIRRLVTSHAFHSPLVEPILDEFEAIARTITYHPPRIPLVANLDGQLWPQGRGPDALYWRTHLRAAVRFADGVAALHHFGCDHFVEIGPAPVLAGMGSRCLPATEATWLPSLRKGQGDWQTLLKSLGALYAGGAAIEWRALERATVRRYIPLPTYPFQRGRYWFTSSTVPTHRRRIDRLHPLIDREVHSAALRDHVYEAQIALDWLPVLRDHRVFGKAIFPATAHLELIRAAASRAYGTTPAIEELLIQQPLHLPEEETRTLQCILQDDGSGHTQAQVFVLNEAEGASGDRAWQLLAMARLDRSLPPPPASKAGPLAAVQERCATEIDSAAFYRLLAGLGMEYGPAFQGIERLWRGENEALGLVRLPDSAASEAGSYSIHPALLDACIQVLAAHLASDDALYLPLSIGGYRTHGAPRGPLWSHAQIVKGTPGDETLECRLHLFNADGELIAEMAHIVVKRASRAAMAATQSSSETANLLYRVVWQPHALTGEEHTRGAGRCLVLAEDLESGRALMVRLHESGQACTLLIPGPHYTQIEPEIRQIDPADGAGLRTLLDELISSHGPLRDAIVLMGAADPYGADWGSTLPQTIQTALATVLHLAQALAAQAGTRLWLATRGAQAVGDAPIIDPGAGALWGLGRVIGREHPELRCTCIDLDPDKNDAAFHALLAELSGPGDEDQVAWRNGERFVARLERLPTAHLLADRQPQRLELVGRGTFEHLTLRTIEQPTPGPGEIAIRIHAAGLNFRDVLNALDMYPGEAGGLGHECAGVVVAVGEGVTEPAVGDAVLAIASDCLGAYAVTKAALAIPKPAQIRFAEAATLPIAFVTAAYALLTLATLRAGDRVLIHAAAGGVGLAAVQIAQRTGAEIYATAGSDAKRAFLRTLGVQHIFDSRTLDFADAILTATGGAGVDVVLNSLSGDFIARSLDVLRDGGCFLEIGKRDIWQPEQVAALNRGIDYHVIYVGEICARDPAFVGSILRMIGEQVEQGDLTPLPLRLFPLTQAVDAFRYMAQARHIGKIVLEPAHSKPPFLRADATYLITGGLGGIGLEVARWMVDQGVRRLVLVGRRAPGAEAETVLRALAQAGAQIVIEQVDISDLTQVAALLKRIETTLPTLRGIIHAAGVLDDGVLVQQTAERLAAVGAPKIAGAWALDAMTRRHALEFFVLFSAGAALVGQPGQSGYAAANAFMDSLAHARRAQGLPALSINWGPWASVGMAASLGERERQRLADQGMGSLTPAAGVQALDHLLRLDLPQAAVLPADWSLFAAQFAGRALPSLFRTLAHEGTPARERRPASATGILQQLESTAPGNRPALLRTFVREHAGRVLALDPERSVDPRQPLSELGLDSLMAVELRNSLGGALGRTLSTTLLFDYPTIDALARYLADQLAPATEVATAAVPLSPSNGREAELAADLAHLSDEEAEALLLAELEGLKKDRHA